MPAMLTVQAIQTFFRAQRIVKPITLLSTVGAICNVPIVRQNLHIRNRQSLEKERKRKGKRNKMKRKHSTPYLNLVDLLRQA